jgi:hypothetical protein
MRDLQHEWGIPRKDGKPPQPCTRDDCHFGHYAAGKSFKRAHVISAIKSAMANNTDAAGLALALQKAASDSKLI